MISKNLLRFFVVGLLASLLHWIVVVSLVCLQLTPLRANLFGYLAAFSLSYFGHKHFSFVASDKSHKSTLPKFILTSIVGFVMNQSLYSLLLSYTPLRYDFALVVVLAVVALSTFIVSKFWVFALR